MTMSKKRKRICLFGIRRAGNEDKMATARGGKPESVIGAAVISISARVSGSGAVAPAHRLSYRDGDGADVGFTR